MTAKVAEALMKFSFCCVLGLMLLGGAVAAQSLKPEAPAPLQAGINKGTVDSIIGSHYWSFSGGPGKTFVHVKFTSMGLLGNATRTTITAVLSDAANTWHTPKPVTSDGKEAEITFDGDLKKTTKLILKIAPPPNGLVRAGGDYQVEATGAVSFAAKSTADPIIGAYKQMGGYTKELGTCKFNADGTMVSTSGIGGKWSLFDAGSQTYVIDVQDQERQSLQLRPGRGLCDQSDFVLFQLLR